MEGVNESKEQDEDACRLYTFAPFTNNGQPLQPFSPFQSGNPGYAFMAAAMMAMDHFNDRNPLVVPELSQLDDCQFRFNLSTSLVFDTGTTTHQASASLLAQNHDPCAIAGPFNDIPGLELSTIAQARKYPLVAGRSLNTRLSNPMYNEFSSHISPDIVEMASVTVSFLQSKGRSNYVAALLPLTDTGLQYQEVLSLAFDRAGMVWKMFPYVERHHGAEPPERRIRNVMKRVKETGYRTIVVSASDTDISVPMADAAEELGMNNGEYYWHWFGGIPSRYIESNANVSKLIGGSGWISGADGFAVDEDAIAFFQAWRSLPSSFVDRLNSAMPIPEGDPGYYQGDPDYFVTNQPEVGAGTYYDAVMAIGMGACWAQEQDTIMTGESHLQGIRKVNFTGATGRVYFGKSPRSGSRAVGTSYWAAVNVFSSSGFRIAETRFPQSDEWKSMAPFQFADGTTNPPALLRDTPEQNYIPPYLQAIGLALTALVAALAIVALLWVFLHREERVVKAGQPHFLYILIIGALLFACVIPTLSFDESYGFSEQELGNLCMAAPWLATLAHSAVYGALFSKLWRVNKVLQFARRKIDIRQVAWPSAGLLLMSLLILLFWTIFDPLTWEREEINADTGESIGSCHIGDKQVWFLVPLIVVLTLPAILTGYMAFKTRDVDESFSESWWIFVMFALQAEVTLVGAPLAVILNDVSTEGRYLGLVSIIFSLPMSTLLLIIGPKVYKHYYAEAEPRVKRGGGSGQIRVSGLPADSPQAQRLKEEAAPRSSSSDLYSC